MGVDEEGYRHVLGVETACGETEQTGPDFPVSAHTQSGETHRDWGMEKASNARVRIMAVEIAWNWMRPQTESEITGWFEDRHGDAGPGAEGRGSAGQRVNRRPSTAHGPGHSPPPAA